MITQTLSRSNAVVVRVNVLALSIGWFIEALAASGHVVSYGFISFVEGDVQACIDKVDASANEMATAAGLQIIHWVQ